MSEETGISQESTQFVERRRAIPLLNADKRFENIEAELGNIKSTLSDHADARGKMAVDIEMVLGILADVRTGFRFLVRLAKFLKWVAGVAISILAIWGLINLLLNGHAPVLELKPGKD